MQTAGVTTKRSLLRSCGRTSRGAHGSGFAKIAMDEMTLGAHGSDVAKARTDVVTRPTTEGFGNLLWIFNGGFIWEKEIY